MIETKSYNGYWNLPDSVEENVAGLLTFQPDGKSELQLLGHFKDIGNTYLLDREPVIHGFSIDGKEITLLDCHRSSRSMSFPGIPTVTYQPLYIVVGAHIQKDNKAIFNELTVEIELLTKWIDIWGYKYGRNETTDFFSIEYQLHDDIEFSLDAETKAIFTFAGSSKQGNEEEFRSSHKAKLRIKSQNPREMMELLDYAWHFKKLLTLATMSNTYFKSIILKSNEFADQYKDESYSKQLELLYEQRGVTEKVRNDHKLHFLFTYKEIAASFPTIIENWFNKRDELEPIINAAYVNYSERGTFIENQFLSNVQALEVFHRRFRQKTQDLIKEHTVMWQSITTALNDEQRNYINRFEYAYEPGLTKRLKELIKEFKVSTIKKLLGNSNETNDFIYRVVSSRNFYTHYDLSLKDKALDGLKLHVLAEKLKAILLVAILHEIGFEFAIIEKMLTKIEPRNYYFLLKG